MLSCAVYGSSPVSMGVGSYLFDSEFSFRSPLAGGSPAASHFLLLRQKKSNQRKGDPAGCGVFGVRVQIRRAYGSPEGVRCFAPQRNWRLTPITQPAVLSQNGVSLELAALRQSRSLIRFAFRSSAQPEGLWGRIRVRVRVQGIFDFLTFCLRSRIRSHPVLAGPVMLEKSGIRAARCLSEASLRGPPLFSISAGCPKRSAGTQTAGRLSFGYFSLAKQRKGTSRRATPGQQSSAAQQDPRTTAKVGAKK